MKTYRNIQNQVLYNSNVIEDFLRGEKTIAEFGIHVIGKYDSWESVPADVKNNTYGSLEIGDCLLIGAEAPYSYYVWTQNEDQTEWLNIGIFPQAGPKGDTGEQGPIGPAGPASKWYYGDTVPSSATGYNEGDMWLTSSSDVYSLTNGVWINRTNIKGATGPQGPQGNTGPRGPIGPRGEKGNTGAQGAPYEIIGILATVDELQAITPQPNIGYFIGAAAPYDIYVSFGDQWLYVGDSGIDVSIYATKAELSDYVTLESLNDYDDSIKEYIDEKVPTKTSELTNDSNLATTTYVDNAVANAGIKEIVEISQGILEDNHNGGINANFSSVEFDQKYIIWDWTESESQFLNQYQPSSGYFTISLDFSQKNLKNATLLIKNIPNVQNTKNAYYQLYFYNSFTLVIDLQGGVETFSEGWRYFDEDHLDSLIFKYENWEYATQHIKIDFDEYGFATIYLFNYYEV